MDCAPADPAVYPGAEEVCNGRDDDCDGALHPSQDRDDDRDGFVHCMDCDDTDETSFPGAPDPLDGVDQDCDGTDGVDDAVSGAAYLGTLYRGILGLALASGDLDGDGCDDLVMGAPVDVASPTQSTVYLRRGCGDGTAEAWTDGGHAGISLSVRPDWLAVAEPGFNGVGRALVFDGTFGEGATPLLEVQSDGVDVTDGVALIGSPPAWLLTGGHSWNYGPQHLNLISLERRGGSGGRLTCRSGLTARSLTRASDRGRGGSRRRRQRQLGVRHAGPGHQRGVLLPAGLHRAHRRRAGGLAR